jgi:hypothetical protein
MFSGGAQEKLSAQAGHAAAITPARVTSSGKLVSISQSIYLNSGMAGSKKTPAGASAVSGNLALEV